MTDVPLDPEVAVYRLGSKAVHAAGNDSAVRNALGAAAPSAFGATEWTVDGDVAFVSVPVHATPTGPVTSHLAARFTLRAGRIWEVLTNPHAGADATATVTMRAPFHPAAVVAGPVADPVDMAHPDYDNAAFCSLYIADFGSDTLPDAEHRRCIIAIASSYVDAEGNSIADSLTLFDPRFSKYSMGAMPNHHPGNGDTNRTDQTALSPTIRLITNKQWTADPTTDTAWIVYDGYLPVSTDKPGFYVAERITLRDGLIWEIMISPVITDLPSSLVPGGPPTLG